MHSWTKIVTAVTSIAQHVGIYQHSRGKSTAAGVQSLKGFIQFSYTNAVPLSNRCCAQKVSSANCMLAAVLNTSSQPFPEHSMSSLPAGSCIGQGQCCQQLLGSSYGCESFTCSVMHRQSIITAPLLELPPLKCCQQPVKNNKVVTLPFRFCQACRQLSLVMLFAVSCLKSSVTDSSSIWQLLGFTVDFLQEGQHLG